MKFPKVQEAMSQSILSVRWNHPMEAAARLMEENKIRHLPVVGEEAGLVGILSDRDVKRALDPVSGRFPSQGMVADFMNWPVITVDEEESLRVVVEKMIEEKISAVVVKRSQGVVGIVTTEDLFKFMLSLLDDEEKGGALRLRDFSFTPFLQEAIREANAAGI